MNTALKIATKLDLYQSLAQDILTQITLVINNTYPVDEDFNPSEYGNSDDIYFKGQDIGERNLAKRILETIEKSLEAIKKVEGE